MLKNISPATFEKLIGLPKGYIENVTDESQFMQDDMGMPDLINFRNIKDHYDFIKDYIDHIIKSLTLS